MANVAYLRQTIRELAGFTRLLASYGCVEEEGGLPCGACGPCAAAAWLVDRGMEKPPGREPVSGRLAEVLREVPSDVWVRPMDVGGRDGNDVSAVLNRLVERGSVEMRRRAGHCRPSYLYRRIP